MQQTILSDPACCRSRRSSRWTAWTLIGGLSTLLLAACAARSGDTQRVTRRDKTLKGAGIGAAAGAVIGAVVGEREADEILAGAAIGAGIGAGVGAYMDRQEERLANIPGTTVERLDHGLLLLRFDSDVLFAVDSSILDAGSRATIGEVAEVLSEYKKTAVVVQGHTDSSGTEEHNQALSERRAGAVEGVLIAQGIDAPRITSVGYGEGVPVASNETTGGRRQNRRVDILLKAKVK